MLPKPRVMGAFASGDNAPSQIAPAIVATPWGAAPTLAAQLCAQTVSILDRATQQMAVISPRAIGGLQHQPEAAMLNQGIRIQRRSDANRSGRWPALKVCLQFACALGYHGPRLNRRRLGVEAAVCSIMPASTRHRDSPGTDFLFRSGRHPQDCACSARSLCADHISFAAPSQIARNGAQ